MTRHALFQLSPCSVIPGLRWNEEDLILTYLMKELIHPRPCSVTPNNGWIGTQSRSQFKPTKNLGISFFHSIKPVQDSSPRPGFFRQHILCSNIYCAQVHILNLAQPSQIQLVVPFCVLPSHPFRILHLTPYALISLVTKLMYEDKCMSGV
jgi:hypothetical protein